MEIAFAPSRFFYNAAGTMVPDLLARMRYEERNAINPAHERAVVHFGVRNESVLLELRTNTDA